jgi:glycosyltransferase involved in cell wall biosynthesis
MKDLGIVICNFNKKDYLRDSVTSILNADFNGISIEHKIRTIYNELHNDSSQEK